jgi:hypothetical protein
MEEAMKRQCKVNLYGSAFPLREELDRQILSRYEFMEEFLCFINDSMVDTINFSDNIT